MAKRRTHEDFLKEIEELGKGEYTLLGIFTRVDDKIKIRHNICGYEYEVTPNKFIHGRRCPKCANKKRVASITKNTEQFKKEVFDLVENEYKILSEYVSTNKKIKIRHNICGYEYEVTPHNFLEGKRCPKCSIEKVAKKKRKTHNEFVKEVFSLVDSEYTVLGEYKNNRTKILIRHNCEKCNNNEYEVQPTSFLSGARCPVCYGKNKKTQNQFVKEVFNLVGDDYTVLGEYKNCKTKILMRHNCEKCNNNEYEVLPNDFIIQMHRCPICVRQESDSKGVKRIENYLNSKNINYIREYTFDTCKNIKVLPFDFYLEDLNLLIEFDGELHYRGWSGKNTEKLKKQKERDKIKNKWCKDNNIPLLRISYKEFNNIEKLLEDFINKD